MTITLVKRLQNEVLSVPLITGRYIMSMTFVMLNSKMIKFGRVGPEIGLDKCYFRRLGTVFRIYLSSYWHRFSKLSHPFQTKFCCHNRLIETEVRVHGETGYST